MQESKSLSNVSFLIEALKACTCSRDVETGMKIHSYANQSGDARNILVANTLVNMYAKCGSMSKALSTFQKIPTPSVVSWNAVIFGYVEDGDYQQALQLFSRMKERGFKPTVRTYVAALKACSLFATDTASEVDGKRVARAECLEMGKQIHAQASASGCVDRIVCNALVDMYANCGSLADARLVFESMKEKDLVSWNSIIFACAEGGEEEMALELLARMKRESRLKPNSRTYVAALKACAFCGEKNKPSKWFHKGVEIHEQVVDSGHETELLVSNSLIHMYCKWRRLNEARQVFERIKSPDVVSWNSILFGCVENGEHEQALQLYTRMEHEQTVTTPNSVTFIAGLKACGGLGALETGKRIHRQASIAGLLEKDAALESSVIDFYGKCGCMKEARQVFDDSTHRSRIASWSALISGYSHQGDSIAVFQLFEKMIKERLRPEGITFLSVLTLCSHAGLVEKGKETFELMSSSQFMVAPTREHYACMVDLFSRANLLDDAVAMIERVTSDGRENCGVSASAWKAVLAACGKWKNVRVGRVAFDAVVRSNEGDVGAYVLMANLYASVGMFEQSLELQETVGRKRAEKSPCSWTGDDGSI